jgi:hypothetical protein
LKWFLGHQILNTYLRRADTWQTEGRYYNRKEYLTTREKDWERTYKSNVWRQVAEDGKGSSNNVRNSSGSFLAWFTLRPCRCSRIFVWNVDR